MNVTQFPDEEQREKLVREKFNEDFKKRWKASGECGNYTESIWDWESLLKEMGWTVELYFRGIEEFTTFVNFDSKTLLSSIPKAYHAHGTLDQVLSHLYEGKTGSWVYEWKEIRDEAHKHVRDSEEYVGTEDFGTVWYEMELKWREVDDLIVQSFSTLKRMMDEQIELNPISVNGLLEIGE